jgi:hypothetical protein
LSGACKSKPPRGANLFSQPFSNVFLIARKNSGKTTVIAKILQACASKYTVIYVFSASAHRDAIWKKIKEWAKTKRIHIVFYTSLKTGSGSHLGDILADMKDEPESSRESESESETEYVEDHTEMERAVKHKKKKKRASKYTELERIFVLDDLSTELKHPDVAQLLKANRHFKCKVLLSSQHITDLPLESRRQIQYFLCFGSLNDKKMDMIHKSMAIDIDTDDFKALYHQATQEKFNFLYIDVDKVQFRKNFSEQLVVPELES